MKKILSSVLAAAMAVGFSATAFAAPIYEADSSLKNTVTGFSNGEKTLNLDVTQIEGDVDIEFGLGENAPYYNVEVDVKEGGRQLKAEYSKSKNAVILRPEVDVNLAEAKEYQVEIEVVDRKTKNTVADGFVISGEVRYDAIQLVDSDSRYNNTKGVLYDFNTGATNVEIYAGKNVTIQVTRSVKGIHNLHMSTDSIEAIENRFPEQSIDTFQFVAHPKFNTPVEVTLAAGEEAYVYEYVNGRLQKPADMQRTDDGVVIKTKELHAFIVSDEALEEGVVDESKDDGEQGGQGSGDKNNPTTGAADLGSVASAAVLLAVAGVALGAKKRK